MSRRLFGWVLGLLVLAGVVFFALSPVFAAQGLIKAAKAGNVAELERRVDFPALRTSLKDELGDELAARLRDDPRVKRSGLGGLGLALAPMLLSGAIDTVVTPQGVAMMVRTGEAPRPDASAPPPETAPSEKSAEIHQSWGYRDLNTFAVTLTRRDAPDRQLALLMKRQGLMGWKLAGVDLIRTQ